MGWDKEQMKNLFNQLRRNTKEGMERWGCVFPCKNRLFAYRGVSTFKLWQGVVLILMEAFDGGP